MTVTFEIEATTSFSTTATLDVDYLAGKAGVSTTFAASFRAKSTYSKTDKVEGPSPGYQIYRQVVIIPTERGDVSLPTGNFVYLNDGESISSKQFVPIDSLKAVIQPPAKMVLA